MATLFQISDNAACTFPILKNDLFQSQDADERAEGVDGGVRVGGSGDHVRQVHVREEVEEKTRQKETAVQ